MGDVDAAAGLPVDAGRDDDFIAALQDIRETLKQQGE